MHRVPECPELWVLKTPSDLKMKEVTIIRAVMVATTMSAFLVGLFALMASNFRTPSPAGQDVPRGGSKKCAKGLAVIECVILIVQNGDKMLIIGDERRTR